MTLQLGDIAVHDGGRVPLRVGRLRLDAGELVAIIGPNGAGKSTLLEVAAGARRITEGRVDWAGQRLATLTVAELALLRAYLPQDQAWGVPFTGRDVVAMGRYARRRATMSTPEADARAVAAALAGFDASHLADRRLDRMSVGERTRIALARVVAQDTPMILLDEPTAALDLAHQDAAMRRFADLARDGALVAAVIHDLNLAARHADRVVLLAAGSVVADGTPREVLTGSRLSRIYERELAVIDHPYTTGPLVVAAN